jgi:lipopolysaccharide/colanic/teichoic acid biosynthesis glycosyltransferase
MIKRIIDIVLSLIGIIVLIPFYLIIIIWISIDSKGGPLYYQKRVGKNNKEFSLIKFRTMYVDSDKKGLLTTSNTDSRITRAGRFLRKYKLDELPQLINILKADMSFIRPRPEVRKYVDMYTDKQKEVLRVRPGLTDYASLEYINENEILAESDDPEKTYIEEIMPAKLELNLKYIKEQSLYTDASIFFKTIAEIFS